MDQCTQCTLKVFYKYYNNIKAHLISKKHSSPGSIKGVLSSVQSTESYVIKVYTHCVILKYIFLSHIQTQNTHDDVIKWKHFPRNWPFVREIHRSPVNFPHKGQWRGALMFSLIYAWINDWVNNREAGDLRRQQGHYDVIVMIYLQKLCRPAAYNKLIYVQKKLNLWWQRILFMIKIIYM